MTTIDGSPVSGPSTTLSNNYDTIRIAIADYLGWTRASANWTSDEVDRLYAIVKAGLTEVYYPATGHTWSWLKPVSDLATTAPYTTGTVGIVTGKVTLSDPSWPTWAAEGDLVVDGNNYSIASRDSDTLLTLNNDSAAVSPETSYSLQRYLYELPEGFAGMSGETINFVQGEAELYPPIEIIADNGLRTRRQTGRQSSVQATPRYASIRAKSFDATAGQRYQLALYPTPMREWNLLLRYKVEPAMLDSTNKYPLGSADVGELVLRSCLAIAEQRYRDEQSLHTQAFQLQLQAAIETDQRAFTPDTLGYNSDRSDRSSGPRGAHDGVAIHSYEGVIYYD